MIMEGKGLKETSLNNNHPIFNKLFGVNKGLKEWDGVGAAFKTYGGLAFMRAEGLCQKFAWF